ncbi:MAG: hypothetical protein CL675_08925 [Bdellovibrionaceae bacterium]|nr:hypothetical protein [Pseudobdellovibrionaceae bacterium]
MSNVPSKPPLLRRYVHLVRHGQYFYDREHPEYGELTELGCDQARSLVPRVAAMPIRKVFYSPTPRAKQTYEVLRAAFQNFELEESDLLVEGFPTQSLRQFWEHPIPLRQLNQHRVRMNKAFRMLFQPPEEITRHDLVITHGNFIRYIWCKAQRSSLLRWSNMDIYQASLTTISVDNLGRIRLVRFGDTGHMREDQLTLI